MAHGGLRRAVALATALAACGVNGAGADTVAADTDTMLVAPVVEVVGSRVPSALPGLVRPVRVVGAADLAAAPARSVNEALQAVPGVIVGQRQQYGVQGDLTIRGSTFDQVLVLIDGVAAGDPQTGHHLLDLPLDFADVARLEVLPGYGSTLYGSGAFGGTLNVVTREPADRDGGRLAFTGGGDGTWAARGSLDLAAHGAEGGRTRLSLGRFGTDGHDEPMADGGEAWAGADARATTATCRTTDRWGGWDVDAFAGLADRAFGARDFYAPFPSFEETRTFLGWARARGSLARGIVIEPRVSVRTHRDRFWLRREQPSSYFNDHLTRRVGAELRGLVDLGPRHTLAVGFEGAYEDIDSHGLRGGAAATALGSHTRRQAAASAELDGHGERIFWQAGLRVDGRDGYAANGTGSAAFSYRVRTGLVLRAGVGSAFRVPTFTDLYYVDPANQGNPGLAPERGWTWDGGLALDRGPWFASATWFERREKDRIEWARGEGETTWRVLNVAEATVRGAETQAGWRHARGHAATVAWTWLETRTALLPGYQGKYALLAPRGVASAQGRVALTPAVACGVALRYLAHDGGPDAFRHQASLDLRADWSGPGGWFAEGLLTNALDRERQEVPGVSLPGRLLTLTVGREF